MIPKIIHLIWIGDNQMPELYRQCIKSWEDFASDYKIMVWDNNNLPDDIFIANMCKKKKYAFASDYLRCKVLYEYGGIYLDADMELIKSLDSLLYDDAFLGYESKGRVANGIMGAIPGHWFMYELAKKISTSSSVKAIPLHTTELLTENGMEVGDEYVKEIKIYSEEYFYPYNPYNPEKKTKQLLFSDITNNTIAIHHWAKNWNISIIDKIIGKIIGFIK